MTELEKQIAFIMECDKAKQIVRQNFLADGVRRENDAEHAFHLALMAPILASYAPSGTDTFKVVKMVLIHDLVEIDAGDTYAYDPAARLDKAEREKRAARRIFGLLPKHQADSLKELWEEFEERKTPEARFARVLDNLQPILLQDASGGKSWRAHGVKKSWVLERNRDTESFMPEIWHLIEEILERNVAKGNLIEE